MIAIINICELCGSEDLESLDNMTYRCINCGHISSNGETDEYIEEEEYEEELDLEDIDD